MQDLGVDFIVHHIGYDERRMLKGLSPMDELDDVVRAVSIPVQAVGGLTIRQAIECPSRGAPLVVLGAPLVIAPDDFRSADGASLREVLSEICREIRRVPYLKPVA
jgi:3-hexulose-6-phosphate synthase/6-phospho-3-hexuloisomerase